MKAINIIAVAFLLLSLQVDLAMAQIKELKVGDKIPNQIMEMVNGNSVEPKPTIINFWATWCVPCIKELRLLDSVLKESDAVNILSVTYEDENTIQSFLERNIDLKSGRLNILTSDTIFKSYFPHRILPHNIWINTEGLVEYITGGEDMNKDNILLFKNNQPINAKNKKDNTKFNPREPFHLSDSKFVYRSIFTRHIDGILSGTTVRKSGYADRKKINRVFAYNSTLNNMLWRAVNKGVSPDNYYNTMRIETDDSLRFFSPTQAPLTFEKSNYNSRHEWTKEHAHCYELRLPEYISDTVFYSYMLDDLKRICNIEVEVIEDSILCSIITADKGHTSISNPNDSTILILNKDGLIAENVSVISLFQFLNETVKKGLNDIPIDPPFIDKTGGMRISVHLEFKEGIPQYTRIKELIEDTYGIMIRHQKEKYKITIVKPVVHYSAKLCHPDDRKDLKVNI
ncbi:TlpA family protein disulfide reductase [Sphingobacterium psychroaquaticum]|uniref:AhpC/TSA family protein n=1 Tax=Sphingobacterium psychroaquaticum TaxID=561061 RepID=A0A1X7IM02_9SPHI|nr:TlpA family protein disulfide reductase [Sphingobacterium psychroaquaticum]SMG15719.1 AhpC/TSA family protein [Sphingobacterium psychroaquaticum]